MCALCISVGRGVGVFFKMFDQNSLDYLNVLRKKVLLYKGNSYV
jgi:hypothetical protein